MVNNIKELIDKYANSMYSSDKLTDIGVVEESDVFLSDIFISMGLHSVHTKLKRKETKNIKIVCLIDGYIGSCASMLLTYLSIKNNMPSVNVNIVWSGTEFSSTSKFEGAPTISILPVYVMDVTSNQLGYLIEGIGSDDSVDTAPKVPDEDMMLWMNILLKSFDLNVGNIHTSIHIHPDSPSTIPSEGMLQSVSSVISYEPDVIVIGSSVCGYEDYSEVEAAVTTLSGRPVIVGSPLAFVTLSDAFSLLDAMSCGRLSETFYLPENLYNIPLIRLETFYLDAVIAFINSSGYSPDVRFKKDIDVDVAEDVVEDVDEDDMAMSMDIDVDDSCVDEFKTYPIGTSLGTLKTLVDKENNQYKKIERVNAAFAILILRGIQ